MKTATTNIIEQRIDQRAAWWEAVCRRDCGAQGRFWYAVRTTGVYCRPGCPARLPRRENVEFFSDRESARQAGYRSCLRCKPDRSANDSIAMRSICRYIESNLDQQLTLAALGAIAGLSPFYLQRKFKAAVGVSPREYANQHRLSAFKNGVRKGGSITNALHDAGYGSSSRLYEKTNAQLGMTPTVYRRGAAGVRIRYTIADSALGELLVAVTDKGLCAVQFAGDTSELQREFPAADLVRDDRGLGRWTDALLAHLKGTRTFGNLPLDLRATAFQRRVWEYLRSIPAGETKSYAEVAAAIGHPRAVRAVGHACAVNRIAIAVPCHRAVRSDGKLAGYRWGLERKQKLLEIERER
ncbi:MAG: bifunctional DNA-binding transcriptional regulator/O6-methylguanine-DNA methyltransferase Ada [Candidatus Binataceae bacterium]|nr:bifunctional DNA-binding transcriptional regulator/O6-methylguanine-DNA methyltransferase Ada [Candidatus Binataceae bacterium]